MDVGRAIELAFLIQERLRAQKLVDSVAKANDVTMTGKEPIHLSCSESGLMTHPEVPHMFVRHMHETGSLLAAAKNYLSYIDRALSDEFGITIEGEAKP
jgi:hypothetical protein